MPKKLFDFKQTLLPICVTLLFASSTCHAEMYKWVDANGKTHYSDNKEEADKAKAKPLAIKPALNATDAPAQTWQQKEQEFQRRRVQGQSEPSQESPVPNKPQGWGGNQVESDATKCALARDILSGAAKHASGALTDKHDIEIAQRDVQNFCH